MLVRAIRTGIEAGILAVRRFVFRQGLAAILTLNGFHSALCYRVVKSPDLIKTDEIKDGERPPLVFFEVEIRDGFDTLFPLVNALREFRRFVGGYEKGRTRTKGGAVRTVFLVVGKSRKAVRKGITEGFVPPGFFKGKRLIVIEFPISFLQDMSGAHQTAQFFNVVWHNSRDFVRAKMRENCTILILAVAGEVEIHPGVGIAEAVLAEDGLQFVAGHLLGVSSVAT